MGFVDLHSHVLPGLDDGVHTLAESLEVVTMLGSLGFDIVCCTPHQKLGSWVPTHDSISKAHAEVTAALDGARVSVDLRLGAENFWDELFLSRAAEKTQPAYTGGKAFLFELDIRSSPPNLE